MPPKPTKARTNLVKANPLGSNQGQDLILKGLREKASNNSKRIRDLATNVTRLEGLDPGLRKPNHAAELAANRKEISRLRTANADLIKQRNDRVTTLLEEARATPPETSGQDADLQRTLDRINQELRELTDSILKEERAQSYDSDPDRRRKLSMWSRALSATVEALRRLPKMG